MSPEALLAEQQRQLSGLAELSLAMAEKLQAAALATDDTRELVRLSDGFCKVSRCLRMAIALSMRLTRGERMAPPREDREDRDLELETERDDFEDLDDFDERPERESLYDRLPSGDLPAQIATIARTLSAAAKALPTPVADTYRARCEAIVFETVRPQGEGLKPLEQAVPSAIAQALTRSRGPPRLN